MADTRLHASESLERLNIIAVTLTKGAWHSDYKYPIADEQTGVQELCDRWFGK
ncbi:MAG TPA: hypothetical protein VIM63_14100 [Rhodoferax sp.]